MKQRLINIGLILLVLIFAGLTFNQCSVKRGVQTELKTTETKLTKANADYLSLVKAKVRIDTVYKAGKTQVVNRTLFEVITDTLYVEGGKVYSLYLDSIRTPELTLDAKVTASDLKAINYTYSVTEKIIREQTILTEHDTLIQQVRKGQLIGLADIGLHSYSAGLQWQSRKRLGLTVRYNLYQDYRWAAFGVAWRIY